MKGKKIQFIAVYDLWSIVSYIFMKISQKFLKKIQRAMKPRLTASKNGKIFSKKWRNYRKEARLREFVRLGFCTVQNANINERIQK